MSTAGHDPLPIAPVPVGEILERELQARGWTQADFAVVLDRPTQFVSEIINGKKEITRDSAAQLGAALGHTAEYWLNHQDQHLLVEQSRNPQTQVRLDEVRRRARLNDKGPIQLLKRRGFLTGSSLEELEAEVMDLFELDSLEDEPDIAAAARRANPREDLSGLQRVWVACVRKRARQALPQAQYSESALLALAESLAKKLKSAEDFRDLEEQFSEVGVRLVYVEAFPGAKIDGCAMFVGGVPVIGLSGRGKRLDKVLFTLLHEVAHLLLRHVDADRLIVESLDGENGSQSDQEQEANSKAGHLCFSNGFPAAPPRISASWVNEVAVALGVAHIVVVGQLQHRGRLDWRTSLVKDAPSVNSALQAWK
ncbi:transcriptional regulator [Aquipuribacter hungaricus]|uniref:Transcriptional regulator n=1 Tax=Aquipuribacter hungaricus TaxID=545624 RepID=A0ABV7WHA0_9MICO